MVQALRIAFVVLVIAVGTATAQSITAADAKNHIGEQATVCGKVASEHTATSSRGEPTFINLDAAYPNQIFTILVWGDDRQKVGELPREGSRVCATGVIQEYRGVPEIVVRSSGQLSK
jgi:DNA/RNA endonuclease YhcR with UshA esterase domain